MNLAEVQLLLVQARNDVQAAFADLAAAMGVSEVATYELDEVPLPAEPATDSADLVSQALRERPDVVAARILVRRRIDLPTRNVRSGSRRSRP